MVESELDAMLIHHACGEKIGALSILTASGKPDAAAHADLSAAARILMVMDWDAKPDGDIPTASNWRWWRDRYPQARLWPVPSGKDPGEAFALGIDIRDWISRGSRPPARWRLRSLAEPASPTESGADGSFARWTCRR